MRIPLKCSLPVIVLLALRAGNGPAMAETTQVDMHKITASGVGEKIGTISLADDERGLLLNLKIAGLPAGKHGFHVHQNGNCGPGEKDGRSQAGIAAGDHFDPGATKSHQGPERDGHKGDLPAIELKSTTDEIAVNAPRLKLSEIRGKALIIHEGGDTYSDQPEAGGGKGRIACGVIPSN